MWKKAFLFYSFQTFPTMLVNGKAFKGTVPTRGAKYKDVISKLFPAGRVTRRGSESTLKQKWATLK